MMTGSSLQQCNRNLIHQYHDVKGSKISIDTSKELKKILNHVVRSQD